MNRKTWGWLIGIYIGIIATIPILFHPYWLKEMPEAEIYTGEMTFQGERAYADLQELVENYPDRIIGRENAEKSAAWIYTKFQEIGLEVVGQKFDVAIPKTSRIRWYLSNSTGVQVSDSIQGWNVIAVSKGELDDIILIGAHRDILGSVQGAEDNGSGTVSMLELARVLTEKQHRYTYVFISFDGEEIGLTGAAAFIRKYPELPIHMAVILDMTGYKDANVIRLYQNATGRGAAPPMDTYIGAPNRKRP